MVALKKMRLDAHDEGVPVTTLREVALLQDLHHENIVRLREVIPQPPRIFLVFDNMDQDLKQCLDTHFNKGMPTALVQSCMHQILRGLAFCHARMVLHRDLKPQNVLINNSGRVRLADFGLARAFQAKQNYTQEVVTLWYRAPEVLLGMADYSPAVDVWSAGCILAEITSRKALFPGDSEIDQIFRIFRLLGTPSETTWPGITALPHFQSAFPFWKSTQPSKVLANAESSHAGSLLDLIITYSPTARISAEAALAHSFFDSTRSTPGREMRPLGSYAHPPASASTLSGKMTVGLQSNVSLVGQLLQPPPDVSILPVPAGVTASVAASAVVVATGTAAAAATNCSRKDTSEKVQLDTTTQGPAMAVAPTRRRGGTRLGGDLSISSEFRNVPLSSG